MLITSYLPFGSTTCEQHFHRYSEASDVFSFGVLLYEMVARCAPWRGHSNMDVVVLVCQV
jgi:serine/threonine protein kinase